MTVNWIFSGCGQKKIFEDVILGPRFYDVAQSDTKHNLFPNRGIVYPGQFLWVTGEQLE